MSLKVALLTNYPIVDNVDWKKQFVNDCLEQGYTLDVHYGRKDIKSLFLSFLKKRKYSNSSVKKISSKADKNVSYFKKKKVTLFTYKNFNDAKTISKIEAKNYDVIVTALDQILSKKFIDSVDSKIVNVHYGILPEIKGVSALEWTYFKHNKCEITLHYIHSGIDTGDIICKKEISIDFPLSFSELRKKVQEHIPKILNDFLLAIDQEVKLDISKNEGGKLYTFMHQDFVNILEN